MTTRSREDVVRAAGRLFAVRGFHGTSMRDLGEELGLLGSSLYSHVDSKEQLLVEVIQRGADLFQTLADDVSASGDTPEVKLATLIIGHVGIITNNPDQSATFLFEAKFLPMDSRAAIVAMRDRYEATYREVIAAGTDSGAFRKQDPAVASIMVLSVLNALVRWYRADGAETPDELAASMVGFVMGGLR